MRRSAWPVIVAAFLGSVLIGIYGQNQGWVPLTIFLVQAGLLVILAFLRRGISRIFMAVLVALQAIPVFGPGPVALVAIPAGMLAVAVMWRLYIGNFDQATHVLQTGLGVAEAARSRFDQLRRLGFRPVASADVRGPGFETIFTYLLSEDRLVYAVLTDQVATLVSVFGPRLLVTMDRGSFPTPPTELRQVIPGSEVEMEQGHREALKVVAGAGPAPDPLEPARVFEISRDADRQAVAFLSSRPWWAGARVLAGLITRRRPDSERIGNPERIRRWLGRDGQPNTASG
jgi:hypothetical protein